MHSQRRTFRAPDEPCESGNELNGCTKTLKIEFRKQEITDTQNRDESTGCTKSLKRRPHRASRPRQEHAKNTHRASRPSRDLRKGTRGASRQTDSTPTAPRSSKQMLDTSQMRVPQNSSTQTRIAPSSSNQKLQAEHQKTRKKF